MSERDEPWHGTNGGYTNHRCRCDRCKAAHNAYQVDYMDRNPRQRRIAALREWVRYQEGRSWHYRHRPGLVRPLDRDR